MGLGGVRYGTMEHEAYHEMYQLEATHWWYRGMRRITEKVLNRELPTYRNMRILDAGCGVGGNLTALATFGKTYGVDYSPLALAYANESHRGRLSQATVCTLPYADDAFDLVISFDVICCREVSNDIAALAEFSRVLRPGGYVLVRVPALPILRGPHDIVVHGVRRYTIPELRDKLQSVGFIPIQLTYLNSFLMPLILLLRQIQNIGVSLGAMPHSDVKAAPGLINTLLVDILSLEAWWVGTAHQFPTGVSALCLAKKLGSSTT